MSNADYVNIQATAIALEANQLGEGAYELTYEGCRRFISDCYIDSLPAKSSKTGKLSLSITASEFVKEGVLKVVFKISARGGCPEVVFGTSEAIDPNQDNDVVLRTTDIMATPDFALAFETPTVTATAGSTAKVFVNIIRVNGFTGSVTISPPPKGNGIKAKPPEPKTTTESGVVFKFKIGADVAPGLYTLSFTAQDSAGKTRNASVTLIVQ